MIAWGDIDAVGIDPALGLAARAARRVESVPEAVMDEVLAVVAIFE